MKIIPQLPIANTTDFTRASTAIYWDKNGILQTAAVNEPRWSYDPTDLTAPPMMLVETAATNTMDYSEDFDNASWTKISNTTVSPNQAIAPNGLLQMDRIDSTVAGTNNEVANGAACANDLSVLTNKIFVKRGNTRYCRLDLRFSFGASPLTMPYVFDLDSGSVAWVGANAALDFGIERLPNDIFLLWVTGANNASGNTTTTLDFYPATNAAGNTAVIGYTFAWGAHNNDGSYIKTTSAAATRAADVLPMATSSVAEADYAAWSDATTYALDDRVIVVTPSSHKVYNSLQNGNLNHTPVGGADDLYWELVGDTNRWKMFDGYVSSQTVADAGADFVGVAVVATGLIDSVSLNNIDAASVRIVQVDATVGTVYDQTTNLVSESGITDYWEYFFSPVERIANFAATDLLLYENATIYVTLMDIGGSAKCGACVLGLSIDMGEADYGLSLGIRDYSVNTEDAFGNISIVKRGYRDIMSLTVLIPNTSLATFKKLLAGLRSTPAVFISADAYGEATNVFGYYESWGKVIEYPNNSLLSISVKGLI